MPAQGKTAAKATFKALPDGSTISVDFNPASLTYSIDNSISQQSGSPKKNQFVAQFSGKLSMDLQFDTTDTGTDVRLKTNQVAIFMQASGNASAAAQSSAASQAGDNGSGSSPSTTPAHAAPVLQFAWGSYLFKGVLESFKETIDFFSVEGVALRALVSITLARQDDVFDQGAKFDSTKTGGSLVPSGSGDSALTLATLGGDPGAARQLGSLNGLESLRFTGGAQLQVGAGVQLNTAAGFAGSVSGGASAGLGISAGVQLSAPAGAGAQFGAGASAGIAASAGAFAGLQSGRATVSSTARLDPTRMIASTIGTDVATYPGARFALGGAASGAGSAGLSADVGTQFRFSDRLAFDSDD